MLLKVRTKFAKSFFSQRRPINPEKEITYACAKSLLENCCFLLAETAYLILYFSFPVAMQTLKYLKFYLYV